MFAVIKTGGLQYRVGPDDVITVGKVAGERGQAVEFGEVLMVGGDTVTVGSPTVAGATVAAEVVGQTRGPKVIAFKKRRRQNSRRKRGFRAELTTVRITEILTDGRRPSQRGGTGGGANPQLGAALVDQSSGSGAEGAAG